MTGREDKKANDLFFTCALVEYIARKTKNKPADVVDFFGKKNLEKIYELADVYHSENMESVSDDLIAKCRIPNGNFDNATKCKYSLPTHWDIGKVYKRLIVMLSKEQKSDEIDLLINVYHSPVSDLIEDYNGSFYYENPQTIYETYKTNVVC